MFFGHRLVLCAGMPGGQLGDGAVASAGRYLLVVPAEAIDGRAYVVTTRDRAC